jgi:hypothetical protein
MTKASRQALLLEMYAEIGRMIRSLAARRRWTKVTVEDVIQETFVELCDQMGRKTYSRRNWRYGYRNALRAALIHVMNLHKNGKVPGTRYHAREIPCGLANIAAANLHGVLEAVPPRSVSREPVSISRIARALQASLPL